MAGNGSEGLGDDFFEQILAVPTEYGGSSGSRTVVGGGSGDVGSMPMVLQLGSTASVADGGALRGGSLGMGMGMPLGLNLEQAGFLRHQDGGSVIRRFNEEVGDVEGGITNNHHQHLRLSNNHNSNHNNSSSSSASSTAGITVSILFSHVS